MFWQGVIVRGKHWTLVLQELPLDTIWQGVLLLPPLPDLLLGLQLFLLLSHLLCRRTIIALLPVWSLGFHLLRWFEVFLVFITISPLLLNLGLLLGQRFIFRLVSGLNLPLDSWLLSLGKRNIIVRIFIRNLLPDYSFLRLVFRSSVLLLDICFSIVVLLFHLSLCIKSGLFSSKVVITQFHHFLLNLRLPLGLLLFFTFSPLSFLPNGSFLLGLILLLPSFLLLPGSSFLFCLVPFLFLLFFFPDPPFLFSFICFCCFFLFFPYSPFLFSFVLSFLLFSNPPFFLSFFPLLTPMSLLSFLSYSSLLFSFLMS